MVLIELIILKLTQMITSYSRVADYAVITQKYCLSAITLHIKLTQLLDSVSISHEAYFLSASTDNQAVCFAIYSQANVPSFILLK